MIISKDNIDANYISCFTDYFHGDEESARACAYEIGRTANTMGIGILELATIHHRSLDVMLQKAKTKADILRTLNVAQQLLSESLASYEMTNRGFYESLEKLGLSNKELEKEIAERKEAEETLKRSEEKYRTIVETATEGIWICDTDARTIFVNKRMAEMLGYSEEEMMGKTAYAFMDQGSRELAKFNLDRRIHGDRDMYEQKYIRKDGSTLWAIASAAPMLDKGGKVIASLGMIMDIT
ncbi:MAG: PAS domain S-box protein, partial [Terracidiphilus sp.]